jgi:uncharacterized membrane protein
MIMDASSGAMLAIIVMACVTIALRLAGFFMMRFVPIGPRVEAGFRSLPGAVAAATFTPLVATDGVSAFVAIVIAVVVARIGRGDLLALVAAISCAVLLRKAGF